MNTKEKYSKSLKYPEKFLESFSDEEILLVSNKPFHYSSGGIGPYYIDLRRGPNNPQMFEIFLNRYGSKINGPTNNLLFVGVPTTGVVYATGLAIKYEAPLAIIEKLNPERVHIISSETIMWEINEISSIVKDLGNCAFLGLEDMGVVLATGLGLKHNRPSAIMRRVQKAHGTSKTIEANLKHFSETGITKLYVINDPYNPQPVKDIMLTLESICGFENFKYDIIERNPLVEMNVEDIGGKRVLEIEDLWTTGTSAINLHKNISRVLGSNAEILVFLDREQNAMRKFEHLRIKAQSVFKISKIVKYLYMNKLIMEPVYSKVTNYLTQFEETSFTDKLYKLNKSCVCVGIDITPSKLPDKREDTILPNYPYERNSSGVKQYCLDLLDEIAKVPKVKVIKPNLAYYNSIDNSELHSIIWEIFKRAKELGLLVILDTKIGDIMRTQSQYAEKYKDFDAVTVHGYMGSDSIFPVTDCQLGCYVLVFTSNPSRIDLETQSILDADVLEKYDNLLEKGMSSHKAKEEIFKNSKKVYHIMAEKVVEWQFAGSVGAVIGGTPNKDGKLEELEEIIAIFADKLNYLPPILIPGVGTQGGTAKDVVNAILNTLLQKGWSEEKIRFEMCKVVINSSSTIDYSPRPKESVQDLVNEINITIETFFKH